MGQCDGCRRGDSGWGSVMCAGEVTVGGQCDVYRRGDSGWGSVMCAGEVTVGGTV